MILFTLLIIITIVLLTIPSLASIPMRGRGANYLIHTSASIASASALILSLLILTYGTSLSIYVKVPILNLRVLTFRITPLSAFFTLVISLVALASSIYGAGYVRRFYGREYLGHYALNYGLFILVMILTVSSWNLIAFLIFWELMTLTSQYLVSFEKGKASAVWAGFKYFCVTKLGADALIVSVVMLAIATKGFTATFTDLLKFMNALITTNPLVGNLVLAMFMIGLMIKAAIVPFHNWLPDAHPEAPSNVSALLSGCMIKVPIYFMILTLNPLPPTWRFVWGYVVATLGTVTLVVGTLYALEQTDSKRLLAYHSIGQVGYIVMALGASLVLPYLGIKYVALAIVAYVASLYHLLNHAVFKSLLFLTAGSVIYRTGSRDLNKLGGLGKFMPVTAATALIASLSIAGVPPFNGFVSKWLIYVSTMCVKTPLAIFGALALFISAVTTTSFIKYFTTLFGREGRVVKVVTEEVPLPMCFSQIWLATLCVALGVLPLLALYTILPTATYLGMNTYYLVISPFIVSIRGYGVNAIALIATYIAVTTLSATIALASRGGRLTAWLCGSKLATHLYSIPGKGYYRIFENVFKEVYVAGQALKSFGMRYSRYSLKVFKELSDSLETAELMTAIVVVLATLAILLKLLKWW